MEFDLPGKHINPETLGDLHRPPGSPRPREIKSQKSQLQSGHRHGEHKDIKWGMSYKTGRRDND